ncbi:MAG TPA: PH domain-containing protein [Mycobacteriales bacterium]|nr:PH domain-containing protein [Mycobacteriales bacterium]
MPGAPTVNAVKLRPSRAALLVVVFLLFCVTPLAFVRAPLLILYLIPLGMLLWIFRSGTDIDPDGVTVRAVAGRKRLAWSDIQGLSPDSRGELRAVLRDGRLMRLPQARLRHLEVIAAASDGHISVAAPPSPTDPPPTDRPPTDRPPTEPPLADREHPGQ